MKKLYFFFITCIITYSSFGQTLLNENFSYGSTPGDLTTITANWTGFSGSGPIGYISTSLSMTDYPSSGIGGSITIDTSSEDAERTFATVNSGVVYTSALFNITDVSSGSEGTYFFAFREGSNYHSLIYTKSDGAGGMVFGVRKTTSDTTVFGTTSFSLGTTYLLVLKYDFTANSTSLYVLPSILLAEPATPEALINTGDSAASLGALAFRQATGGPDATVDGVRVATSWSGIMIASDLVLGEVTINCNSTGSGDTDDTYTATIDFIGGDNGNDFVLTTNAGTISGDSPTSSSTGTITISNIPEGTDITFNASDTADGGTTSKSKSIDSPACIPLIMNEILYDVPSGDIGDANGDGTRNAGDDEFIEFVNNSGSPLDISGYKIYVTNAEPRHVFPSGSIIPANGYLVVFGDDTPTGNFGGAEVQVASTNALGLINGGVIISITNSNDDIIETYDYTSFGSNPEQSITRNPKVTGNFVNHSAVAGGNPYFSPGLDADKITIWNGAVDTDWDTAGNWDNGVPASGISAIIKNETNNPIASGAITVSYLDIKANAAVTINGAVTNSNEIALYSGATLIAKTSVSGSVSYQRNLNFVSGNANGWHLVSSPVAGQTYNNAYATANDLAISGSKRGLATYNDANVAGLKYTYLEDDDSNASTFASGNGYSVKRASTGTITFTGTMNTDNINGVAVSSSGNGFNLLGNPYTSYISSQTFLNENSNLDQTQIWVWKQDNTSGGNFIAMTTKGDNFILAPAQGFFVKATSGTTVNFAESNQLINADTFQKSSKTEVKLLMNDGEINRFTKFYYLNNVTKGFDAGYEGEVFGGIKNSFEVFSQLVEENQGKNYQVQSLPKSDFESMIVQIGVVAAAGKEITFTTEALNLPSDIKVFLEDKFTNTFTRLDEANSNYKVTLSESLNGIGRFYLHTKSSALSVDDENMNGIYIYKTNNSNLRIVGLSQGKSTVKLFNVLGKQLLNTTFTSNSVHDISLPKLATGIYIIHLETETGKLNRKITLE